MESDLFFIFIFMSVSLIAALSIAVATVMLYYSDADLFYFTESSKTVASLLYRKRKREIVHHVHRVCERKKKFTAITFKASVMFSTGEILFNAFCVAVFVVHPPETTDHSSAQTLFRVHAEKCR